MSQASIKASRLATRIINKLQSDHWKAQFPGGGEIDPSRCRVHGDAHVQIAPYSYAAGLRVYGWGGQRVTIGRFCSIADDTAILVGGRHDITRVSSSPWPDRILGTPEDLSAGDVVIGNDVWLGHGATVVSGVQIGDGAVVLAHALVTKDVKPYAIVGGLPAKHIGWRFDEQLRAKLQASQWWMWPEDRLRAAGPLLRDPEAFVAALYGT